MSSLSLAATAISSGAKVANKEAPQEFIRDHGHGLRLPGLCLVPLVAFKDGAAREREAVSAGVVAL